MKMTSGKIAKARRLRNKGKTYQAIADILGVSYSTIHRNLVPKTRRKDRLYNKQYYADHKEEMRKHRADHKEEMSAYSKQHYIEHKRAKSIYAEQYYADHKRERSAYSKQYRESHREERRLYRAEYYKDHKEKIYKYRRDHREEICLYGAEYRQTHKSKYAAYNAKRRSLIAEATIGDMDQIREIYRIAREEPRVRCYLCLKLTAMGDRAVDHIFPVSKGGPFRPSTLAVTHKKCNGRKSAKTPEEIGLLL